MDEVTGRGVVAPPRGKASAHPDPARPDPARPDPMRPDPARVVSPVATGLVLGAGAALTYLAARAQASTPLASLTLCVALAVATIVVRRIELRSRRILRDAARAIAEREERFRAIVADSTDIVIVYDEQAVIRYVSPGARRGGYEPEDLVGRSVAELMHPDQLDESTRRFLEAREHPGAHWTAEYRVKTADGSWLETEAVTTNLLHNPAIRGFVVNLRDVTERKAAEAALHQAQERFRSAFEEAPIGMGLAALDGRIMHANRAFGQIVGRDPDDLVGMSIRGLTHPDDWAANEIEMRRLLAGDTNRYRLEKRYLHADGHVVWASVSVSLVRDEQGCPSYMIGQIEDVTERKAISEQLAHAAIHDQLTDLPNRVLFLDRLGLALARAQRVDGHVAVLFLDLDRFNVVNDSLGHPAGDRLLVAVAERLRSSLRPSDTVARFGGDEFTVLCDEVNDELAARDLAERMALALSRPFQLNEGEVFVTASIGIATSSVDDTAETLLRDADAAMHRAKDQGRARIELFDAGAHDRALDSLRTGNALHRALDRGELDVHYQPIVDVRGGRVRGFEALVRWRHPERGLVLPGEFIPLAEETGLIVPVGLWVLEEACRQTCAWQARRSPDLPALSISVNLAPRQVAEPTLPERVAETLARTGIDPDAVWLEITESALAQDAEHAIGSLRALRELGVHLSVDDFGTGYSSLSHLKRFPVEALKVDRSFVDGLGRDSEDTAIVGAVVSLAHSLGLVAVAEGIETERQLAELRTLGCDHAQGFLFGRPRPAEQLGPNPADDLLTWERSAG